MRSSKGNEKRSAASAALIALLFVFVAGVLVFAVGAIKAAKWIVGKPHGLYDMNDLIAAMID